MIPRLYLENETNFNHNGIGALTESLSAVVVEEANGIFTLEIRYPISGRWFSEITKLRLIKALTNLGEEEHIFRIDDIVKSSDDKMVTILASSKTNELAGHIFTEFKDTGQASQIMTRMKSKITPPTTYNFVSDMNTEIKVEWFMRNVLNSILGQEGSMVDKLGGGELRRTNNTIYLYRRRGNENVARVSETKNLRGLTITESTKGLITRIQPYIRLQETNSKNETVEKVIIGDIVSSPLVNNYPLQIVVPVDFGEYEFTNKADLDAKAKTYFTSMNPDSDKPKTELEIDLLQISDSSEYARFKHFEKIKLFDTVTVYAPRYGVDTLVKIVRVEFDVLREKVISLKAGQPKSSYSQALEKSYANKIDDKLSGINDKINIVQMSADGKNQVFTGPNEPDISVSSEGDTWFKVLGNGEMEMYIFDGAYWQVVINANTSKEILDKIDQAETDIAQNILDIDAALDKATQAELDAGFSKDLAEEAKSLGATASSLASEAKTNANKAMTDAQEAIRQAGITGGVAADASADATEAKRLAGLAEGNSQEALTKANASVTDASKALTDATKAFNKSFKSSTIAYATSTNGSTPPSTGWGTTVPTPSPDVYIWTRTTILLNDNTPVVSYSVGKIGAKGDQGSKGDTGGQGIQGVPGVNAPTIKSVVQQFYLSTSKTTQTGGSWLSTVPVWSSGKYYWVRVVTTYSNDTTSTSTPVLDNALNDSLVTALEVKTANQNLSTTVTQHATLIEGKANTTTVDAIAGRVTTAEGSISTIAGQVELKANSTDVQTLTGRVTTAEGKITTQAGQIALKANTTDVNTLTGRVTTAEGNITTQAGQIALKANQSVVDTLTGRVTATEASIKVTDGKVTTLTTKTDGNTTSIGQLQTGYDGLRSTVTNVDWMARTNGALQLTPDPTFLTSMNRLYIYNNSNNANVAVKRVQLEEGQPTGSPYIISIATTGSPTSPGLGGVVYNQYSRANAIFMIKFTAKIPTGYTVYHAMNSVGIGAKVTWVTSREGTGTWTEYAYVTECGSSGSFSNFGHIYLATGVAPVTWYIAKYELFDISKSQQQAFSDLQQNIDGFKTTVANTYADKTTVTQLAGQVELKATKTDVDALTGRVSTAEGKITTQAGQIALKANTTTVNTLTGRVTTAEGNITTQAGQIALKANQSTVDTLTGRVSTTEAKITATDGKVTTLTTKTDGNTTSIGKLQTGYDGLSSTVTALETGKVGNEAFSALEQNLSGFKTTVQNTYADKTTVTQLAGQWTTTTNLVNGHTSQISSLGTQINLRATKTEVAESILADKKIKDTRNTNQLPPWYYTNYPNQQAYEFKLCSTIGLPTSAGTYASVVTAVPWTDASGGPIEQTATASDGVYQRRGTTTWSAWAKVADSSNIISQINISPESILIASKKIQIKGDTYIDNSVIKTAHIADLAVSGAKIANASISSAKIISLDASKINAGTVKGLVISSTSSTGQFSVQGQNAVFLNTSTGRRTEINETGVSVYNSTGTILTQFNQSVVNTSIVGTNTYNVYLGTGGTDGEYGEAQGGEVRVVRYDSTVGGTGAVTHYTYRPIRAEGFVGNYVNANTAFSTVSHLYLRPRYSTGEVRVTGSGSITAYQSLRASGLFANTLDDNSLIGGTNIYIRPASGGEVRVTKPGTTDQYQNIRASVFYASALDSTANNMYVRGASRGEVRATVTGTTSTYIPVRASSFPTGSLEEYKTNIRKRQTSALSIIRNSDIYEYNLKSELESGKSKTRIGLVIGDGYNTPTDIIDGDGVEQYAMSSLAWQAIQELDSNIHTVTQQLTTVSKERLQHTLLLESKLLSLEKTVEQLQQEIEQLK